ncbi:MAG: negative regulator of flagellin synthesis FlgM [Candidatus Azotimanducaceae bacterium]|jgi:negative regulator of flagellin synthesis FlgM
MVNNINGLSGIAGSASRSREQSKATDVDTAQTAANRPDKPSADQVELSSGARDLQNIESRIRELPDVNQERVTQIKEALRDGSYTVDPSRLAAKIVQFESNL